MKALKDRRLDLCAGTDTADDRGMRLVPHDPLRTQEEVARRLGCSCRTVKRDEKSALEKLAKELADLVGGVR